MSHRSRGCDPMLATMHAGHHCHTAPISRRMMDPCCSVVCQVPSVAACMPHTFGMKSYAALWLRRSTARCRHRRSLRPRAHEPGKWFTWGSREGHLTRDAREGVSGLHTPHTHIPQHITSQHIISHRIAHHHTSPHITKHHQTSLTSHNIIRHNSTLARTQTHRCTTTHVTQNHAFASRAFWYSFRRLAASSGRGLPQ